MVMNKWKVSIWINHWAHLSLCTFLSGVCGIAGASIYANQIVASFRMATYPNYGGGMGMGGMGGGMGGMGGGMGGMGGMPT